MTFKWGDLVEEREKREELIEQIFGKREPCGCPSCRIRRVYLARKIEAKSPPPARPNAPYSLRLQ
jgi:hypothetical protein